MRWLRARRNTPPTWSPCSWVTRMPASDSGATSSACSRRRASRRPNPQSTSTLVRPPAASVAWTTRALPSLPLPRLAKRTFPFSSPALELQLFLDEAEHPGGRRAVGLAHRLAVAGPHPDGGRLAAGFHANLEDFGLRLLLALGAEQARQEAALLRAARIALGVDVAHEVHTVGTVPVLDGETATVEREPDPSPGTLEAVGNRQERATVGPLLEPDRRGARGAITRGRRRGVGLLGVGAEAHHQPAQDLDLELRIARPR